jgi:tetratricopeptide (TPR) repeat protein
MLPQLHPNARPSRFVLSALALGVFCWGIFGLRISGSGGPIDVDEARRLQDDAAYLRRLGRWRSALEPTLRLHTASPESHTYLSQLAEIYHHLGRYGDEAAMWEEFLVHAALPIEGCPQIGQAYEKQGSPKQAIRAFEKCLALDPKNPDSILYLGLVLEHNGETARAAALYESGIVLSPGYGDLRTGLARTRLRQGRAEDARKLACGVLDKAPTDVDALLVAGLACQRLGDRGKAREYLERGVHLADAYADFHVALGNMAEQDADLVQARTHYRRVMELDKSNGEVAQRLDSLERVHP